MKQSEYDAPTLFTSHSFVYELLKGWLFQFISLFCFTLLQARYYAYDDTFYYPEA